jgi:hypothetical protein
MLASGVSSLHGDGPKVEEHLRGGKSNPAHHPLRHCEQTR